MIKDLQIIKDALKEESYVQGFNAVPVFLNSSGLSGFMIKKYLGFGYEKYLFNYKKDYGEMFYFVSDFKRLWKIIREKLEKNPNYLKEVKSMYDNNFSNYRETFEKISNSELRSLSDKELLSLLNECVDAQMHSIGLGHILEAGIEIEQEFKDKLAKLILDKKEFNRAYVILTTPTKLSFIAKEQYELHLISRLPIEKQENELRLHQKKYFWIRNSYAGPKELKVEFFKNRLNEKIQENKSLLNEKKELIKKLNLSEEIIKIIEFLDFSTNWQDERKANALKTIGYFGRVLEEISKRVGINKEILYYLSIKDIKSSKNLNDIKKLKQDLEFRREGVFFLMQEGSEIIADKEDYKELVEYRTRFDDKKGVEMDIHGSIANGGTAIGKVVICKDIDSIGKVMKGDILVTSMTRPEFMPALKNASAIVTDEGGITSHAAIVARELGIPAIIGTKIATKVLKDGMIVEVKANHGIVKILEKEK